MTRTASRRSAWWRRPAGVAVQPQAALRQHQGSGRLRQAEPGKLTFATFGPGTSSHLAGELFKQRAGIDILHVPFKGATQALPALISGDVDLFFDMVATGMPQAAAGKVKVFAITSPGRLATEPALPTLAEQGYQGFDMTAWFSFVAAREPVLERLRKALADALADDAVKQRLLGMGIDPRSGTPAELQAQIRNEQPIVSQLIKQAGVALQ